MKTLPSFPPFRALFVTALLLMPAALAAQPAPAGPVPPAARWGVVNDHIATSDAALQKVRDAGFGWVRYLVFWTVVNPTEHTYNWQWVDEELARIQAAGLNAYFQVAAPPPWALSGPPVSYTAEEALYYCLDPDAARDNTREPVKPIKDCMEDHHPRPEAVHAFATAIAARYKGRVKAYGFGGERHSRVFWQGAVNGEVSRDQFVDELLRPAYLAIKSVDPEALVVGPDVDRTDELEALLRRERDGLAAGKSRVADVVTFHTFAHGTWYSPDAFENGISGDKSLAPLKDVISRFGAGRPLWLTEMGFWATAATREQQATWLDAFMRGIAVRPWIDKAFVYRMLNDGPIDFGLLNRDDTTSATPAFTAAAAFLGSVALPKFYFLAEGAAGTFFDMDIAIANPNATGVPIKASFLKKDGTVLVKTPTLAPRSRSTIRYELDVDPSPFSEVSTVIESTLGAPLAVERTLFWNNDYYAGHTGSAVSAPSRTWYFGEGFQGLFDTFVLLANATTAKASVTVTFLRERGTPVTYDIAVPANSRQTVSALQVLENGVPALEGQAFAIRVDSDVPIIAERSMYFNAGGLFWGAGHESAGVSALSTTWFLAEGKTGPLFDTYILVGNPSPDPAEITFTFLIGDPGVPPVVATTTVAAAKRFTLDAESAYLNLGSGEGALTVVSGDINVLRNAPFSTKVESTNGTPIVVERAMYWPGAFGTWAEAHNSFGVTETGVKWALAEGRAGRGRGFETYILIANPSLQAANVTLTFLRPSGAPVTLNQTITPTSRQTVAVPWEVTDASTGAFLLPDDEFSIIVESTNGVEIVVERAMYWNGPGASFWAGGSNATAVKLQ